MRRSQAVTKRRKVGTEDWVEIIIWLAETSEFEPLIQNQGRKKTEFVMGPEKNIEKDKTGKKRRMEEIKWQRKFIEMETRKEERRKGGWSKIK